MPTPKEWTDNLERLHKIAFPEPKDVSPEPELDGAPVEDDGVGKPKDFADAIDTLAEETVRLMHQIEREHQVLFLKFVLSLIIVGAYERANGK